MSKCHSERIMPKVLSIYVELSTGNENKLFLQTWHKNLQLFSQLLISQMIIFCDQTISKVNEEIGRSKAQLHAKPDRNEWKEIISTFEKNYELHRKYRQQRKTI